MAGEAPKGPRALGPGPSAADLEGQQWAIQRRIEDIFAKLGEKYGDLTGRVEVTSAGSATEPGLLSLRADDGAKGSVEGQIKVLICK